MNARHTMRESDRQDPLWRVRALAGLDPLSAEAFAIRGQPLQRGERRLIGIQFEIMQLIMLFDELADACGVPRESEERQLAMGNRQLETTDAASPPIANCPLPIADAPKARLAIAPPDARATLIVADEATAEAASLGWEASHGGAYGLFVARDLDALAGGLAPNAGGYDDWRHPHADLKRPAATMRWKGRVFIVLPGDLAGDTVSAGTKWEKFISAERRAQALGVLAAHWWRHAGACDVQIAVLTKEERQLAMGNGQSGAAPIANCQLPIAENRGST